MVTRAQSFLLVVVAALQLASGTSSAPGKDYLLTIGGGYGPSGTQVSLEKNVIFLQSVLAEKRPDHPAHDVYFADGNDAGPDVQYRDPNFLEKCPPARRMMGELLGDAYAMDLRYRNNEISNLRGPADSKLIRRRMRELSRELKSGDRLIVYATGHGGAADDPNEYRYEYGRQESDEARPEYNQFDTTFYLWDHETITASEFSGWLDRLPTDVRVVLVMVQCYAGGFSHTIFHQADADLGLAPHSRAGFFAQVHDRAASGCTADINEADYQEYSSFFWAALAGHTRTGAAAVLADFNDDGHVSFLEAHAHAVIESNTIDIPLTTSAAFLRKYSRLGKEKKEADAGSETDNPIGRLIGLLGKADSGSSPSQKIVELKGPLAKLTEKARPEQRVVIERLSQKLQLGTQPTVELIRRKQDELKGKSMVASAKVTTASQAYEGSHSRVQEEIREMWPELHHDYSPLALELASDRADEFVAKVKAISGYEALARARELQKQAADDQLNIERTEAKFERLMRTCEDVALAANLAQVAPAEIVARYEKLLALEGGTLAESQ